MTTNAAALNFLKTANKNLADQFKERNFAGVAACYTKDAVLMPPGNKACKGLKAIEKWWQATGEAGIGTLTLRTTEVDIKGSSLIESGGAILRDKKGKVVDSVKYIVVWKKAGKTEGQSSRPERPEARVLVSVPQFCRRRS